MPYKQSASRKTKKPAARVLDKGKPVWEVAHLFPLQGAWTESDYFKLDHLPHRFPLAELFNGRLEILPMPTEMHQLILIYFFEALKAFTQQHAPGLVLVTGMKIKLGEEHFRQPDVLYMKAEHTRRRRNEYWESADLVVEVVSGGSKDRARDLQEKVVEYARAKIPEYWIIDPKNRCVRVLTLRGQTYQVHGEFGPGTRATGVLLPGFAVAVDKLLAPPGSRSAR
jgi:Uma2 family endonuclease